VVLPEETVGLALLALAVAVVVLLGITVLLAVRLRRMRRTYAAAVGSDAQEDLFEVLRGHGDDIARLRKDLGVVHGNTEHLRDLIRGTVSRVGVIRYNAFDDMGGALSFSAALLDEHGDGVVVSAINGRTETRTYAKPVVDGQSEHHLSPEEQDAIREAISGEKPDRGAAGRGRRRRAAS
jgi:hypothetical protein